MTAQPLEQPAFLDRHYTVAELAKSWHMSPSTLRTECLKEPEGVITWGIATLRKGRQRTNLQIRISEAAARRIYDRLTQRKTKR